MPSYEYTVIVNGRTQVRTDDNGKPLPWDAGSAIDWCRKELARHFDVDRAEIWRRREGSRAHGKIYRRYEVQEGFVRRVERFTGPQ